MVERVTVCDDQSVEVECYKVRFSAPKKTSRDWHDAVDVHCCTPNSLLGPSSGLTASVDFVLADDTNPAGPR